MKNIIGKALTLSVSTLVSLTVAEFIVRILYPQPTLYPRYIVSSQYATELPRNAALVHRQGGQWKFIYHTNELGRRGRYVPIGEEHEQHRVVVLGDSFTFGFGVNDDEVYTQVMSERLGQEFAVVNGGMGGWGIDSEIKWFFRTGAPYKPKYVVLQFTANDPADSFTGVTEIENGRFVFHAILGRRPGWQTFLSESSLIQNSHLYSLVRNAYERRKAGTLDAESGPVEIISSHKASESELNYVRMLGLFAEALNGQGMTLVFLSVTHREREPPVYHYDLDDFPIIEDEVTRLSSDGKLVFVDLPLAQLAKYPGSPEGHQWSDKHHAIVGTKIAEKILELEKQEQERL